MAENPFVNVKKKEDTPRMREKIFIIYEKNDATILISVKAENATKMATIFHLIMVFH